MNTATRIGGVKVPLTSDQVDAYRSALTEVKPHHEAIGRVAIEMGLTRSEMAHLTEDWLLFGDDLPKIRVPPGEKECESGGNPPCPHCQQKRGGVWSTYRVPRAVPVFNSETAELLRVLLGSEATLGSIDKIQDAIQSISEEAGIDREEGPVRVKTVQNTFIVKLLDDGFSIDEICRIMGYEQPTQSHQYSVGTPQKIKELGHYCEGEYPFYCNAEITSREAYGDTCSRKVQQRDDRCIHHDREWARCRAVGADGSPCMKRVSDSDARCRLHSDQSEVCGHPLDDGSRCQIGVSGSAKCAYHREDRELDRCGATLDDGEVCRNKVSDPSERCSYHWD